MDVNEPTGGLEQSPEFVQDLEGRYRLDAIFEFATWAATAIAIGVLAWLLISVLIDGLGTLDWQFITSFPSRKAERAGILPALQGTILLMVVVATFSFPLGVGAAIYLEEFATDNWFTRVVEILIGNLAGVPSIIYGLLGLTVFLRLFSDITQGPTILSGGLTLTLLILPVVIVATRESLRAVPDSTRLAGFALGANRWQVVWSHVLPAAMPGVMTGMILALSRAIGDTATLLVTGAAAFIPFSPDGFLSRYTALPIQIYNWASRPQAEFHNLAASGIIVLMAVLLIMNTTAVVLRNKFQQRS
ncbi:MAG: phosphate ABC transporter permease PstA [Cyanothece sp. SIO2G6]|nr:phosphate ABC transporter permease PstA [Cyanothece sp. SIO2G6]